MYITLNAFDETALWLDKITGDRKFQKVLEEVKFATFQQF